MTDATVPPPPPAAPPPPPPTPPPATPPPPPPGGGASGGASGNRTIMLVLSYLWLLALIPLLVEKNDGEVQWHAKHGLVLMVAEFIMWLGITTMTFLLGDFLGCIAGIFSIFLWFGILILHVVLMVKAVGGNRMMIPGISEFANKI